MANTQRDELRARLLGTKQFKTRVIDLLGDQVEIRQPSVKQLTELTKTASDEDKSGLINLIIRFCYVPGTQDTVFEPTDYDVLMELPADNWIKTFQEAWIDLAGLNKDEIGKNS